MQKEPLLVYNIDLQYMQNIKAFGGKLITVTNLSLSFNGTNLFKNVDLKFLPGNCYGIIGGKRFR